MNKILLILLFPFLIHAQGFTTLGLLMEEGSDFAFSDIPNLDFIYNFEAENLVLVSTEIDSVYDISGNGNHANANNGAIHYADSLGTMDIAWFDGVNDNITITGTNILNSAFTIFVLGKAYTTAGSGRIVGNGLANRGIFSSAAWSFYQANPGVGGVETFSGSPLAWTVLTLKIITTTSAEVFINETKYTFNIVASSSNSITLGVSSAPLNCAIAEVVGYARTLTDAECLRVIQKLESKIQ